MATANPTVEDSDNFKFFGLGGCNEVGRSCHILEYKNKVIMLDSGVHPGLSGMNSLPFFDEYDLSKVDVLLISHFHLDHAASLPYVMQQTNFRGRVFMTHATKAIYRWLLSDFVRVTSMANSNEDASREGGGNLGSAGGSANLYTDEDLMTSFERIETIDYHSTIEVDGIRFTAYHAGHVLGACMYLVEVGGVKVLFTGDYSREEDRHLKVAEVPPIRPDILITESTFGTATHEPRLEKESRMMKIIHSTILKGGRILMPVFALGRAQELLLILEEYWSMNKDIQQVNIYYASNLARKCMAVYQTYTSIMSEKIRLGSSATEKTNPFDFKFVKSIKSIDRIHDIGPCVVVASPGMLQSGVSRQLLERWAPDPKNAVIMTGYSVEGTMAKDLLTEPPAIKAVNNPELSIPRRISVDEISFAAHVDFIENSGFIEEVNPKKIILVHGDSNPMGRLKSALRRRYHSRKGTDEEVNIFNPRNCELLEIEFKGLRIAKVLGSLAESGLSMMKQAKSMLKEENEELAGAKVEEVAPETVKTEQDETMQVEPSAVKTEETLKSTEGTPVEIKTEEVSTEKTEPTGEAIQPKEEKTESKSASDEKQQDTSKTNGIRVSGVLVAKDFDMSIMNIEDLPEYTQLSTSVVRSNIKIKVSSPISLISWHLEQMFGYIHVVHEDNETWECLVMDMVYITVDKNDGDAEGQNINVEWINDNMMGDSLADSVVAILLSADSSPASVKLTLHQHNHNHEESGVKKEEEENGDVDMVRAEKAKKGHARADTEVRVQRIRKLLKAQFGDSVTKMDKDGAVITIGKNEATIDFTTCNVVCGSRVLKDRVENVVKRGATLAAPLSVQEQLSG